MCRVNCAVTEVLRVFRSIGFPRTRYLGKAVSVSPSWTSTTKPVTSASMLTLRRDSPGRGFVRMTITSVHSIGRPH